MCGIAGILKVWTPAERELALRTPHGQSIPEPWLDILDDSIKHRGPDGHGRFRDRAIRKDGCVVDVALVHRRLSIIDHAGGHQPMVLRIPKGAPSASSGGSRPIPGRLLSPEQLEAHNRRILAEAHSASHETSAANNPELALGALSHDHIAVVFNGCIYNHRELRAELQRAGHVFSTNHSDTEVLVHGWREWERNAVLVPTPREDVPFTEFYGKLEGMYSLAVWDGANGMLSLARDRCGEKPLYVLERKSGQGGTRVWAFASGVSGLCHLAPSIGPAVRVAQHQENSLWTWVRFGFAHGSLVEGITEVTRGRDMGLPQHLHGEMFSARTLQGVAGAQPFGVEQADSLLAAAVESRLEADVPIGCFLSGGVDSSLIAHYAKRKTGRLSTFTVRMPDARFDESEYAVAVARHLGTSHSTLDCQPAPTEDLVGAIHQLGLPFGDSSLLPTMWVSRATREHVRVALSGDGGDELFMGYERYAAVKWIESERAMLSLASLVLRQSQNPRTRLGKLARLAAAAREESPYDDLLAIFPGPTFRALTAPKMVPMPVAQSRFRSHSHQSAARARAIDDLHSYLPDDILRKTDTASMSVALEVRSPMLADALIFAATAASERELMPRGQRKGLLRQVARKYLPAEIVDRPKMGFAIPIGEWFRSDYGGLRTMLLDHLNSTEPFGPPSLGIDLNMKFIRQMLDEHLGTGPSGQVKRDHSQRLYMLLVLSIWAKWLGGLGAR